jgi:hypothetical protein
MEGLRSARSTTISPKAVEVIRRRYRQESLLQRFRTQEQIEWSWTVYGTACQVGMSSEWIRRQIARGIVTARHHPLVKCYLVADDPTLLERLQLLAAQARERVAPSPREEVAFLPSFIANSLESQAAKLRLTAND